VPDPGGLDLDEHLAGAPAATSNGLPGAKATAARTSMSILKVAMRGGAKRAKVCMRRLQKQGRAMKLVTMYAGDT
jgi:hypothetical protein